MTYFQPISQTEFAELYQIKSELLSYSNDSCDGDDHHWIGIARQTLYVYIPNQFLSHILPCNLQVTRYSAILRFIRCDECVYRLQNLCATCMNRNRCRREYGGGSYQHGIASFLVVVHSALRSFFHLMYLFRALRIVYCLCCSHSHTTRTNKNFILTFYLNFCFALLSHRTIENSKTLAHTERERTSHVRFGIKI